MSAQYIGTIAMAIPSGRITEIMGNITLLMIGLVTYIVFEVLVFFVDNFAVMIISRLFIGVAEAVTISIKNSMCY